jgi:hypothetical protein
VRRPILGPPAAAASRPAPRFAMRLEPHQGVLPDRLQQAVAPVDGVAERVVARREVPGAHGQQREAAFSARQQRRRAQRDPRRQLDGQRQPVQAGTDLGHGGQPCAPVPLPSTAGPQYSPTRDRHRRRVCRLPAARRRAHNVSADCQAAGREVSALLVRQRHVVILRSAATKDLTGRERPGGDRSMRFFAALRMTGSTVVVVLGASWRRDRGAAQRSRARDQRQPDYLKRG